MLCRDEKPPLIVAIDLQPMAPIEGVIQVQGDITNARTAEVVCTVVPFTSVNRCLYFFFFSF
jgi:23S rRNA U2552 (ribose-2'-O)-methylase RlmE/FtsJ